MKAQIQLPSKISLKAISMIMITLIVLETLIVLHQYVVTEEERKDLRNLIDLGENLLGDKCWIEDTKGVFVKEKLSSNPCISLDEVRVVIEEERGEKWEYGHAGSSSLKLSFPCVIKDKDTYIACRMVVER